VITVRGNWLSAILVTLAACGTVDHVSAAWLSAGSPVAQSDSVQFAPVITTDGLGGAFIAWQDFRSGGWAIYLQRLTADGAPAPGWPVGGLAASDEWFDDPDIVADGRGGAFVAASNGRSIIVRHVSADATVTPALSASAQDGASASKNEPGRLGSAGPATPATPEKIDPTSVPVLIPDGKGGAFLAYEQGGWLSTYVSVRRITEDGNRIDGWGGPVPGNYDKFAPVLCSDGADGLIVAWRTYGGIRATRFGSTGALSPGWPEAGCVVCSAPGNQDALGIVPDGAGGAIVVWQDARNGLFEQVFAQHITSAGVVDPGWPLDGRPICTLASSPGLTRYPGRRYEPARYSSVASDGAGGALIAWSLDTADGGDILAQHLLADGLIASGWPENGLPLCTAPGSQVGPSIAADGVGGAFVTWQDRRSAFGAGVYAQHVNGAGDLAPGWTPDGLPVCATPQDHLAPRVAASPAGGAIIVWQDLRCPRDAPRGQVFVSPVSSDGSLPSAPGLPGGSAMLTQSAAESGTVRLTWQTAGASSATTTVYRRQVDGPWMPVGTGMLEPDRSVTYIDAAVISGCRYGYGVGMTNCGGERVVGDIWINIPEGAGFSPLAIATQDVSGDAGRLRVSWRLAGGAGLNARIFRRDSCSDWTEIGATVGDKAGQVTFEDPGLYEGHKKSYRLRVHVCGQDREMGEFGTVIPSGRGFIPTTATLLESQVGSGGVHLTWKQLSGPPSVAEVYRRDSTGVWSLRATLNAEPSGMIRFFDSRVFPGNRYEYVLGLRNCDVEPVFGPTELTIPVTASVPQDQLLQVASPAPPRRELTVLFALPSREPAVLEVFDVRGRRLLGRDVGGLGPGDHALVLADVSVLTPGFYLVRLSQNGQSRTARAILMR
jgi:hypothetical protein